MLSNACTNVCRRHLTRAGPVSSGRPDGPSRPFAQCRCRNRRNAIAKLAQRFPSTGFSGLIPESRGTGGTRPWPDIDAHQSCWQWHLPCLSRHRCPSGRPRQPRSCRTGAARGSCAVEATKKEIHIAWAAYVLPVIGVPEAEARKIFIRPFLRFHIGNGQGDDVRDDTSTLH